VADRREAIDFARWVEQLQAEILKREQELFSAKVLAEARDPKNLGAILDADGHALVTGPCGDTMEMFLRVDGTRIERATFLTDGCGPTVACGSMLTRMARGKRLEEAAAIEATEVIAALDGLPEEHEHCATLAVNTLHEAIASCRREGAGGLVH
jgi:nitrogen fixation NifU-like protein